MGELVINGIDAAIGLVQANSQEYLLGPFPTDDMQIRVGNRKPVKLTQAYARKRIELAWTLVAKAAAEDKCNAYFRTLPARKSLSELLQNRIFLHFLKPRQGYTDDILPMGVCVGRHIGINLKLLGEESKELAATLVHELAHYGGASVSRTAPEGIAAETALLHCGFAECFDSANLGSLDRAPSRRGDVRLV